ncbi:MAG: ADP-ribosylglycohydrolase family protein [Candidatus Margulisiibacteriota bacterium]
MQESVDSFIGAFAGCLAGNVLGSYSERLTVDQIHKVTGGSGIRDFEDGIVLARCFPADFRGKPTGGWFLPAAIAESICETREYRLAHTLRKMFDSHRAHQFVIGNATAAAFEKWAVYYDSNGKIGRSPVEFARPEDPEKSSGTGVAKRAWPLGLFFAKSPLNYKQTAFMDVVLGQGFPTHYNIRSSIGAFVIAKLMYDLIREPGISAKQLKKQMIATIAYMSDLYGAQNPPEKALERLMENDLQWNQHRLSGFVLEAVPFVVKVFFNNPADFRSGILTTVNAGGNASGNAAMLGALLGAKLGVKSIPESWRESLPGFDKACELGEQLFEVAVRGK